MAAWDEEFQLFGKVELPQKVERSLVILLGLVLANLTYGAASFTADRADSTAVGVAIGVLVAACGIPAIAALVRNRSKPVIVDADGVRLPDGFHLPWEGIDQVDCWWTNRGALSVVLMPDEDTMHAYQGQRSRVVRMLTGSKAGPLRSPSVYLPPTLTADPVELATWLRARLDDRRGGADDQPTW